MPHSESMRRSGHSFGMDKDVAASPSGCGKAAMPLVRYMSFTAPGASFAESHSGTATSDAFLPRLITLVNSSRVVFIKCTVPSLLISGLFGAFACPSCT